MYSSKFFSDKAFFFIARLILKREISGSHTISDQSLLLSTIVLNDNSAVMFSPVHVLYYNREIIALDK